MNGSALDAQAADVERRLKDLVNQEGNENWAKIRFLHREPHFVADFRPVFVTLLVDEIFQTTLHIGRHGANRLGSNSLAELVVFGRLAGEQAMRRAAQAGVQTTLHIGSLRIEGGAVHFARLCGAPHGLFPGQAAEDHQLVERRLKDLVNQEGNENWAKIRDEMGLSMEEGCGMCKADRC
jgi:succinate dehydrogenase/fumarate reductase flavoprotein subunit